MAAGDAIEEAVFDPLIKELDTKVAQLETNAKAQHPPTRKELEIFVWKCGRVVRLLVKPEASNAREIFWSECKGLLKKCLIIEKFNPSSFTSEAVRPDIVENDLLEMLRQLTRYTSQRKSGRIAAPDVVQTLELGEARKRKRETEEEEKKQKEKDDAWQKRRDQKFNSWAFDQMGSKWDDALSDAEEECPDKKKNGSCAYGRQCGFCFRE
mmetsp:Transcript_71684/g.186407  ORF Transcript_71684/g.186407 Transcript_71684/m.186407 type:complete len:210 (+) Transcript_71684:75-704(+)